MRVSIGLRATGFSVLFFLACLPSQAGVIFVDSLADPGVSGDGLTTLREAITAANTDTATDSGGSGQGADIIDLSGLAGIVALDAPLPAITTRLDILGPANQALIISGGGAHAYIENNGPGLLLASLVFEDAYVCDLPFGAIRNEGALTIEDCVIRGGRAAQGAGVVNEAGATVAILGTRFEDNRTTPEIYDFEWVDNSERFFNFGAVLSNYGDAVVEDSHFEDNHAFEFGILQNMGRLTVERCQFLNNGGAVFGEEPGGNEPFGGRSGDAVGPVIHSGREGYFPNSALYVRDCNFEDNLVASIHSESPTIEISRSSIIRSEGYLFGTDLWVLADAGLVSNSTFFHTTFKFFGNVWLTNCTEVGYRFVYPNTLPYTDTQHAINLRVSNCILGGQKLKNFTWVRGKSLQDSGADPGSQDKNFIVEDGLTDLTAALYSELEVAPNGTKYFPLRNCGPAQDTGDSAALTHPDFPGAMDTDQTGAPRVAGAKVDFGSHELAEACTAPPVPASDAICTQDLETHPGLFVNSLADPGEPDDGLVTLREALLARRDGLITDLGQSADATSYVDLTCLSGRMIIHTELPELIRSGEVRGPADRSLTITSGLSHLFHLFLVDNNYETNIVVRFQDIAFEEVRANNGVVDASGIGAFPQDIRRCSFLRCGSVFRGHRVGFTDCAITDTQGFAITAEYLDFASSSFRNNNYGGIGAAQADISLSVFDSNGWTPVTILDYLEPAQTSTIERSLFTGNTGTDAGALSIHGNVNITNCTFSGNRAVGGLLVDFPDAAAGGAIHVRPSFENRAIRLTHCTIVGNTSAYSGGGIFNMDSEGDIYYGDGGAVYIHPADTQRIILKNCIVAGNAARLEGPDIWGEVMADRDNVVGNPLGAIGLGAADRTGFAVEEIVGSLLNNGGPHRTHAVLQCGPAFDYCSNATGVSIDELGNPRKSGCKADTGAYELQVAACAPVNPADCPEGGPYPTPEFTGTYRVPDAPRGWVNQCDIDFPEEREGWDDWEGEYGNGIPENPEVEPFPYEGDWEDNLIEGEFDEAPYQAGEQTYMRTLVSLVLGQWIGRFHYGGGGDYDTPAPDLNRDGRLSQMEAYASIAYLQEHPIIAQEYPDLTAYRTALFGTFDLDGNGYIRTAELNYWVPRLGFNPLMHSADADGDFRFSLSELLRIVQFYNVGGIGCGTPSNFADDGYQASAALPDTDWCLSSFLSGHSSDFDSDSRISLPELLRAIQLYNGRYLMNANSAPCQATEDYFCDPGFWTDRNVYFYVPRPGRSVDQIP